ncbi:hypothetical protein LSH36_1685g00034 [Paralvinella palmiformis]|uniref:Uncharacterized protein n=1 Tax=Paralvinella palmiformis TaxID=53620 RepID=A0AAD9MQ50_9ANNE|nr:hypothetical protein LSH36_1685g00034 [Paralvinella palmiformis]
METTEARLTIDDVLPWYIAVLAGFQHYLVMFVATVMTPFFFASAMCLDVNSSDINDVINTTFFVFGITTVLQATFGIRYL